MSDLTALEKRKLEKLFGMGSGYVLDFTNQSFADFIRDCTGRNIYDQLYDNGSGSKANRLRAFWQKEDNALVGKLLKELIEYSEAIGAEAEVCRLIVTRLLNHGRPGAPAQATPQNTEEEARRIHQQQRSHNLRELKDNFFELAVDSDRNRAGLALEKLLNRLFTLYDLQPRQPFRIVGEQIDGSFHLDGNTYLLESKWEKRPLPEADLLVFRGKIEGKSTFTRGVMIALNGISDQARMAITQGKAPSFFVMTGHDLIMVLSEEMSLPEFLRKRVRLLAEEGRVCVDFAALR